MTPQSPRRAHGRLFTAALATAATVLATLATAAPAPAANPVTPGNFTGHGFDQCLAPTQSAMDAWLKHSPFLAVGIYIAGDSRGCRSQPNLTPRWVGTQLRKGWRLLPITLGPQASCHPSFPRYSDDRVINPRPGRNGSYSRARKQARHWAGETRRPCAAARHRQAGARCGTTSRASTSATPAAASRRWRSCPRGPPGCTRSTTSRASTPAPARASRCSTTPGSTGRGRSRSPTGSGSPAGTAGQHPDRLHPRRRLAAGRPDEAVPRRPPRDLGRRHDQHRQQLARPRQGVVRPARRALRRHPGELPRLPPRWRPAATLEGQVRALQCLLKEAGAYDGRLNGAYNDRTRRAAARWQTGHGYAASTTWSRRHWMGLTAAGPRPVLKLGSAGEPVRRVQRALNAATAGGGGPGDRGLHRRDRVGAQGVAGPGRPAPDRHRRGPRPGRRLRRGRR